MITKQSVLHDKHCDFGRRLIRNSPLMVEDSDVNEETGEEEEDGESGDVP